MLDLYRPFMPSEVTDYYEPFVGGGAMLGAVLDRYDLTGCWINDANPELINFWQQVQKNPEELIGLIEKLGAEYFSTKDRSGFYYDVRACNAEASARTPQILAAYFFFLIKTCFNGFFQVNHNTNERFGTPPGPLAHVKPFWDADLVRKWSRKLQGAMITCDDWYEATPDPVFATRPGSFIFFDPPYRGAQLKRGYAKDFSDDDHAKLVKYCASIKPDSTVFLCNRDLDDGFLDAYKGTLHKVRFDVTYTIARGGRPKSGAEVLFHNHREPTLEEIM